VRLWLISVGLETTCKLQIQVQRFPENASVFVLDTSTSSKACFLKLFHRPTSKNNRFTVCRFQKITFSAGLVLELDEHKMQCASKRLAPKGSTFILVEKKQKDANDDDYDAVIPFYYSALLDDYASLYPDIKVLYNVCACRIKQNTKRMPYNM